MSIIKKIGIYIALLVLAALTAAVYGALHNQISYTVSSEYFTKFKFIMFSIGPFVEQPRLGVALIGALASWWMGFLLCLFLGVAGFWFKTPQQMFVKVGTSFFVVMLIAIVTGFIGLAMGFFMVNETSIAEYARWLPDQIDDPVAFVRAGFMHNASYLGTALGMIAGAIYLILSIRRLGNKPSS